VLLETEIQRVNTARTIEAILVAIAVREETESRRPSYALETSAIVVRKSQAESARTNIENGQRRPPGSRWHRHWPA
jgi:hypothetical protein